MHILTETQQHTYTFGSAQNNYYPVNKILNVQEISTKKLAPVKSNITILSDEESEDEEITPSRFKSNKTSVKDEVYFFLIYFFSLFINSMLKRQRLKLSKNS